MLQSSPILDVCKGLPGYTSGNSATWEIVQQEKIATCEECNRRRMQNENIATCQSATWNSAIHKESATWKKVQHETINTQKNATW